MAQPKVRRKAGVGDRWLRRSSAATGDYQDGIRNPRKDWAQETEASAQAWADGVQRSIQRRAFEKGVGKAGTGKWSKNAQVKGVQRYAQGVAAAKPDYEAAMQPVMSVIESTDLPRRGARGSAENQERSRLMNEALHRLREE